MYFFIRGFNPIIDHKYVPFKHPCFHQTADGKGEVYEHKKDSSSIGAPIELLSEQSVAFFEKRKEKGERIFIDQLSFEELMLLDREEMGRRMVRKEEKEQKKAMVEAIKLGVKKEWILEYFYPEVSAKELQDTLNPYRTKH